MLNLFKKKVSVNVECGLCGFYGETVMYALLFCKNAREVWELTLFLEVIQYRSWFMLRDFIEYASSVSPGTDFHLVLVTMVM